MVSLATGKLGFAATRINKSSGNFNTGEQKVRLCLTSWFGPLARLCSHVYYQLCRTASPYSRLSSITIRFRLVDIGPSTAPRNNLVVESLAKHGLWGCKMMAILGTSAAQKPLLTARRCEPRQNPWRWRNDFGCKAWGVLFSEKAELADAQLGITWG